MINETKITVNFPLLESPLLTRIYLYLGFSFIGMY